MKSFLRLKYIVAILWFLSTGDLFGKIRNGYEPQLYPNKVALHRLKLRIVEEKNMSPAIRHSLRSEMKDALDYITLYELTEELIYQLKAVSPRTYHQSDTIRDKRGRPTDIYVKLIPKDSAKIKLLATSYVWQTASDKDLSFSEYGERSASIEIWLCDNALFLFSHELGHLNYIIQNLSAYTQFYSNAYSLQSRINYIGHSRYDQSGSSAEHFQKMFLQDRKEYLRNGGVKPPSPLALINPIRRNIKNTEEPPGQNAKQLWALFWRRHHFDSVNETR
ncbi:MAG TPA: hypothetical protein VFW11_00610 [Cyclobacteriaceae bacterium]|nr:hypothetical protein [Cyclobacteriaceae bacterium]